MPLSVRHQGALRSVTRLSVRVGGVLRPLKTLKVMDNGTLRTVANFAPAMSASASPSVVGGNANGTSPATVTTNAATCTPSGGVAPFIYSWSVDDPSVTITNPTSASTRFTATLFDDSRSGIATCVVTDSLGTSATATAEYHIQHINLS